MHMGVGRGEQRGILKLLAKKGVFSISSGKKQISPLLTAPWKKSFRRP